MAKTISPDILVGVGEEDSTSIPERLESIDCTLKLILIELGKVSGSIDEGFN